MGNGGSTEDKCEANVKEALQKQCVAMNTQERQTNVGLISLGIEQDTNNGNNGCDCGDGLRRLKIIVLIWVILCVGYIL